MMKNIKRHNKTIYFPTECIENKKINKYLNRKHCFKSNLISLKYDTKFDGTLQIKIFLCYEACNMCYITPNPKQYSLVRAHLDVTLVIEAWRLKF